MLRLRYGADHSCYPFYMAFLIPTSAEKVRECQNGSVLTSGQAKRINRECGFPKAHKENLWYCPSCVREDLMKNGETCWRRLPQMPGAVYCPMHREKFRESGISYRETSYRIIPATYALIHTPEPVQENGTVYAERYISLARDISWLLCNGFSIQDREWFAGSFFEETGRPLETSLLYKVARSPVRGNRFEDYLANRIIKDSGKDLIDESVSRQIGSVLSIQRAFGSIELFHSM